MLTAQSMMSEQIAAPASPLDGQGKHIIDLVAQDTSTHQKCLVT